MPYTSQPYVSIGFTSVSNRSSVYSTDRVLCFSTCKSTTVYALCACWHNISKPPVKVFRPENVTPKYLNSLTHSISSSLYRRYGRWFGTLFAKHIILFVFVFTVSLFVMQYECKASRPDCNPLVVLASNTRSSAYFNTVIFLSLHHIPISLTLFISSTMSSINIENRDGDRHSPCRSPIFNGNGSVIIVIGSYTCNIIRAWTGVPFTCSVCRCFQSF